MPDDHALPVSGVEHDLLRLRQAGGGGRRAKALGKILNRALRDVEQRHERAIAKKCVKHEPLQSAHSRFIPRPLYMQLSKVRVAPGLSRLGTPMNSSHARRVRHLKAATRPAAA